MTKKRASTKTAHETDSPEHRLPAGARVSLLLGLPVLAGLGLWNAGLVPWSEGSGADDDLAGAEEGADGMAVPRPELVADRAAVAGIGWPEEAEALIRRSIAPGAELQGKWKFIVFHHSATAAGSAAAFDAYHRKKFHTKDGILYQFVVGNGTHTPDGAIEATSRWGKQLRSGHLINMSRVPDSIAICVVGDLTKTDLSAAQYSACVQLARALMKACGIPVTRVTMHCAVDGTRHTACPGGRFPLERIKGDLSR